MHIALFGKRNSGKSTLVNALTGQETALVSETAGTTTDPVSKAMEINGLGPCVLIDTAGFDDRGPLGSKRVEQSRKVVEKTDIALLVFRTPPIEEELRWLAFLETKGVPAVLVLNESDDDPETVRTAERIERCTGKTVIRIDANRRTGLERIREALIRELPADTGPESITGHLVTDGDLVLLVMPQDIQAPKGRLILPQVQTIRDLLDRKCIVTSCTTDRFDETLRALARPPKLIVTDSQVFRTVYERKPAESRLTSFSVLFARYKGDIAYYAESARAIGGLPATACILIAEACTHAPLAEDIGRVKLPNLLRNRIGQELRIEVVSGNDFPTDLRRYDLVIHCGGCMFNRRHLLSRIEQARQQQVPMTNYGIAIAYLTGILDRVEY